MGILSRVVLSVVNLTVVVGGLVVVLVVGATVVVDGLLVVVKILFVVKVVKTSVRGKYGRVYGKVNF